MNSKLGSLAVAIQNDLILNVLMAA